MAELLGTQIQSVCRCWLVKVGGRLLLHFLQAFRSQVVVRAESLSRVRYYITESKVLFSHMIAKGGKLSLLETPSPQATFQIQ